MADAVGRLSVRGDHTGSDGGLFGIDGKHRGDNGDSAVDEERGLFGVVAVGGWGFVVELADDEALCRKKSSYC